MSVGHTPRTRSHVPSAWGRIENYVRNAKTHA